MKKFYLRMSKNKRCDKPLSVLIHCESNIKLITYAVKTFDDYAKPTKNLDKPLSKAMVLLACHRSALLVRQCCHREIYKRCNGQVKKYLTLRCKSDCEIMRAKSFV